MGKLANTLSGKPTPDILKIPIIPLVYYPYTKKKTQLILLGTT